MTLHLSKEGNLIDVSMSIKNLSDAQCGWNKEYFNKVSHAIQLPQRKLEQNAYYDGSPRDIVRSPTGLESDQESNDCSITALEYNQESVVCSRKTKIKTLTTYDTSNKSCDPTNICLDSTSLRCQPNMKRIDSLSENSKCYLTEGSRVKEINLALAYIIKVFLHKQFLLQLLFLVLITLSQFSCSSALLVVEPTFVGLSDSLLNDNVDNAVYNSSRNNAKSGVAVSSSAPTSADNLERNIAAVLIKTAYGTSSTTKRSIPDNIAPALTTIATPLLTTLRYFEKSPHQQQINYHHRNYELDLERDHALPTSAPNADILKSNSNPTYPNPNRHHNHDRERHRHLAISTPLPSLPNLLKKNNGQSPTIPMYSGDIPSYSPPARSFFTPPLPPEYQNPFADKPTLRGTNNEGIIANSGTYINRRPIPPPSLMPGHERIPLRPPDLAASTGDSSNASPNNPIVTLINPNTEADRKKALNTPSRSNTSENKNYYNANVGLGSQQSPPQSSETSTNSGAHSTHQEVLPSIRRILSGSNGNKGEIPEVLLKQATSRPVVSYHQPPSSPVVLVDNASQQAESGEMAGSVGTSPINKSKNINSDDGKGDHVGGTIDISNFDIGENNMHPKSKSSTKATEHAHGYAAMHKNGMSSTPSAAAAIGEGAATSTSSTTTSTIDAYNPTLSSSSSGSSSSSSTATAAAAHATWTIAWNVHIYLSVILFTILAVYSLYKMLTYNKLTHLFTQSYFVCIHLILIIICTARIFYLCYDAYNTHSSFHIFVSEILLNLPATFLTTSFSILILFLFLKSFNHKNNRYSALIRPLTVVVGCGVHVGLCITLHYVESYTMQNHQHLYYQQQQLYRRQQPNFLAGGAASVATSPPPRVLSLICQIIYIFICLSLGLLYLYLYRILKRILRSKSQNYIHGYQNLSYAIHITIATALLFVLLAALQIFGAISISTTRPLITQATAEIDWLQWGYQFSLRLIEIAIITLTSWVASLKTSGGSSGGGGSISFSNGDARLGGGASGGASGGFGSGTGVAGRDKHRHHHNHSNVANFFLPCTSSSSQEQFDTDYPAVCNANTNLHTYTMRTGKLIYDDSFALNSLAGNQQSQLGAGGGRSAELQLQQPTYHRPYDTSSINSSANHNVLEYATQSTLPGNRYHHDMHPYADCLTDATTDHYENPNFDLRSSGSGVKGSTMQKFAKTSTTSTTASSSGGSGSSAASQQQMLLLQSDSCYSEPLQVPTCNTAASTYEFNNFERPKFGENNLVSSSNGSPLEYWPEQHAKPAHRAEKKSYTTLERSSYENPERRSSNSTHSCTSSNAGGSRYNYNSFDHGHYNGVRKSGTLNNIVAGGGGGGNIVHSRNAIPVQRPTGVQTLAASDRHHHLPHPHHSQRSGHGVTRAGDRSIAPRDHDVIFGRSSLERNHHLLKQTQQHQQNSDDDMMLSGSNVEHTNLINNEDGSCLTYSSSTTTSGGNLTDQGICSNSTNSERLLNTAQQTQASNSIHTHLVQTNPLPNHLHSEHDSAASTNSGNSSTHSDSATSGSMLVAELGFVRFRALDDINNAQGVGIHNASIRNQINRNVSPNTNANASSSS